MGSAPQQPSPRPTLEELLRFKRAERPAPEFWAEFDRGLRQKQLAALVKRPQGWARVSPGFARSLKWIAPATAAVAVALVVVQMPLSTALRSTSVNVANLPVQTVPIAAAPVAENSSHAAVVTATFQPAVERTPIATAVAQAEPVSEAPAVVVAEQRSEGFLPWSTVSVAGMDMGRTSGTDTFASLPAAREMRRPRSSWTSRYSEMAQEISAEQSAGRVLQLASFDLSAMPAHAPVVARADPAPVTYATDLRAGRAIRDRDFRDMESRMGSSSRSSLAFKF